MGGGKTAKQGGGMNMEKCKLDRIYVAFLRQKNIATLLLSGKNFLCILKDFEEEIYR